MAGRRAVVENLCCLFQHPALHSDLLASDQNCEREKKHTHTHAETDYSPPEATFSTPCELVQRLNFYLTIWPFLLPGVEQTWGNILEVMTILDYFPRFFLLVLEVMARKIPQIHIPLFAGPLQGMHTPFTVTQSPFD